MRRLVQSTALVLVACPALLGCDLGQPESVEVQGIVTTPEGRPVKGVSVRIEPRSEVFTDRDGYYRALAILQNDADCLDSRVVFTKDSHTEERPLGGCGLYGVNINSWPEGG